MDEQLKRRLVGAAVIVSLIVIFVPMLLDEPVEPEQGDLTNRIPDKPQPLQQPLPAREILPEPIPPAPPPMTSELVKAPAPAPDFVPVEPPQNVTEPPQPAPAPSPTEQPKDPASEVTKQNTPSAWLVQVGSFSQEENATNLVQQLRQADMPAQLQVVTVAGKRLYRVQMLPQLDKKDAETLIERIKKEFKLTASLLRYSD